MASIRSPSSPQASKAPALLRSNAYPAITLHDFEGLAVTFLGLPGDSDVGWR